MRIVLNVKDVLVLALLTVTVVMIAVVAVSQFVTKIGSQLRKRKEGKS